MLNRTNWELLFGAWFVGLGIAYLLVTQWIDAAWSILLGVGCIFVAYGRQYPEVSQKRGVRALVIGWGSILAILTLLKITHG